jgi:hypothetical protein
MVYAAKNALLQVAAGIKMLHGRTVSPMICPSLAAPAPNKNAYRTAL